MDRLEELAKLDRAAADTGLAIVNELVCVLGNDGKQAALNRAEEIRDRLKQCRDRARAALRASTRKDGDDG